MLSVFQRASIRADINPQYSKGFNPRPKISLPLPRPVGVDSDDELIVIAIDTNPDIISWGDKESEKYLEDSYAKQYLNRLSEQLPEGCELLSSEIVLKKPSFQPCGATYIFTLQPEYVDDKLKNRINSVLSSKSLIIDRPIDNKGRLRAGIDNSKSQSGDKPIHSAAKKIDLRDFLISIITEHNCIIVNYKISSAGTIRIQEIMQLLGLETEMLACPIKRTNVQWQGLCQEKCL